MLAPPTVHKVVSALPTYPTVHKHGATWEGNGRVEGTRTRVVALRAERARPSPRRTSRGIRGVREQFM